MAPISGRRQRRPAKTGGAIPGRRDYRGPAILSYGFRPFFLAAALFGLAVVPAWVLVWQGDVALSGPFTPVDWHIHEMIFGYAGAVIAGFLFTAVPNWTGRMPARGWPLLALLALWLLGRIAVAGFLPLGPLAVMTVDCGFLAAIAAAVAVEIVAGRNWRNLKVVVPVLVLCAANVTFHLEAMLAGSAEYGRRLGLAVVVFLIALIGGRIIPSFTRNWLTRRSATAMPAAVGRFDALSLVAAAAALAVWVALPSGAAAGLLLILAAALHLVRLVRWRGAATWRSPLLLMLHVAYAFVPLGLAATGAASLGVTAPAVGLHLLGIGAIGGMTTAVMMRATRGHTGRSLEAGVWLSLSFALVVASASVRALGAAEAGNDGVVLAAALWTLAFGIFCVRVAPWLAAPSVARRQPNAPPSR